MCVGRPNPSTKYTTDKTCVGRPIPSTKYTTDKTCVGRPIPSTVNTTICTSTVSSNELPSLPLLAKHAM